jgi:hypothetical protein
MTGGVKAHNKGAVGQVFQDLGRMEQERPCMGGYIRFELPDYLAIFCVVLECAKSLFCMPIDVKACDLVQIDGSEHRWFEDRAAACTLPIPFNTGGRRPALECEFADRLEIRRSRSHEELRSQIPYIGAADLRQDESEFTGKYVQCLPDSCAPSCGRAIKHRAASENEPSPKAKRDNDIGAATNPAVEHHLGFRAHHGIN